MTKSIVLLYNNITTNDPDYVHRMQGLTEFCVNTPADWSVIPTTDIDTSLQWSLQQGYEWAFINALGHMVYSPQAFLDTIAECEKYNSPILCHIIHIPGQYPGIDNQFFAVNLAQWQSVGCPAFQPQLNKTENFKALTVNRSTENFHDDYTPLWIAPGTGEQFYTSHTDVFGYQAIDAYLRAGLTIRNIPHTVRNTKYHLYPNNNYELINTFRLTGGLLPETEDNKYPRQTLESTVYAEYAYLKSTIYPLNSESLINMPRKHTGAVDHLIGVAGGFKNVLLLKNLDFHTDTIVTYMDISQAALDYQMYIASSWNGNLDNYWRIFTSFESQYSNYKYAWRNWNDWNTEIESLLADAGITRSEFQELWKEYQNLELEFVCADLLENTQPLVERVQANPDWTKYIWISNAYDMAWSRLLLGKEYTSAKFYQLLKDLNASGAQYDLEAFSVIFNQDCQDYEFLF